MGLMDYPALLLPGLLLFAWYWCRRELRSVFRTTALIGLILLAVYPRWPSRETSRLYLTVVDRSRSILPEQRKRQDEVLDLLARNLIPGDKLGIISVQGRAWLEGIIGAGDDVPQFQNASTADASALDEGVDLALQVARGSKLPAQMIVLSDGLYTGSSPVGRAIESAAQKVPVWYRFAETPSGTDLAVREGFAPGKVTTGEPFEIAFEVVATSPARGLYRVLRNGKPIGVRSLPDTPVTPKEREGWRLMRFASGVNRITAVDLVTRAGAFDYTLEVLADQQPGETILENNKGSVIVNVIGEDRLLLVTPTSKGGDNLATILASIGIPVDTISVEQLPTRRNALRGYKAVILDGASILNSPRDALLEIRRYVEHDGGSLLVMGGPKSYSSGGYKGSPLEALLPVSLNIESKSIRTSLALSIVIDRSGSMSVPVPGGQQKIDLANAAAAESVSVLTANDSLSVIAVDSMPHVFVEQQPIVSINNIIRDIKSIQSEGGGIFVYTGLVAAGDQLATAPQLNKHVILFADANDAEEPGEYISLLADFRSAGVTVTAVGLGTDRDADADFLKDVARRGGGEVYFTDDPFKLPQLFAHDVMQRTRSTFEKEPHQFDALPASESLAQAPRWQQFTTSDFNLLFPRDEADTALMGVIEDLPIAGLAFWQRGTGRVASLAFDSRGAMARNAAFPALVQDVVRWLLANDVQDSILLTTRREGHRAVLEVELSEQQRANFQQAEAYILAPDDTVTTRTLRWTSPATLEVDWPLDTVGAYRGHMSINGEKFRIDPITLPGSPEFLRDLEPEQGHQVLSEMARLSNGKELIDMRELVESTDHRMSWKPIARPIALIVLLCILLDVADQRFALAESLRKKLAQWRAGARRAVREATPKTKSAPSHATTDKAKEPKITAKRRRKVIVDTSVAKAEPTKIVAPQPQQEAPSYLREAKERARQRTKS